MLRLHGVVFALLLFTGMGLAENASNDQETIRLLVQQVKELQEQVKALQAERNGAPKAGEAARAEPQGEEAASQEGTNAPSPAFHELHGIQWHGFGEFNYKVLDQRQPELGTFGFAPGSAGNFYTGDFDLLVTSRINDKASVLSEIVFGEGLEQAFDVDLERLLFRYNHSEHLKLSLGRYRTGIGYYNTAFESGKWLETTASRPLITEFAVDGGLLPTQAVGLSITGLIPSGSLGLNYIFEYGSSDTNRPHIDGSGLEDDDNNGNHVNLYARDVRPGMKVIKVDGLLPGEPGYPLH
jgi:hypothetical protein